jgi:hypothetical protein
MQDTADVSFAKLGDRGAEAFATALAVNPYCKSLSIKDNHLHPSGFTAILKSVLNRFNVPLAAEMLQEAAQASQLIQSEVCFCICYCCMQLIG